jgi:hypothetical protein
MEMKHRPEGIAAAVRLWPRDAMATPRVDKRGATATWLQKLRDEYSDDIPAVMVHSDSQNPDYKVRGGWWLVLELVLEHAASEQLFSPNLPGRSRALPTASLERTFRAGAGPRATSPWVTA